MKDIGEERHRYPGAGLEYLCRTCQQAKVRGVRDEDLQGSRAEYRDIGEERHRYPGERSACR